MKNFYLSIVMFCTILAASVASNIYVKEQMNFYKAYFNSLMSKPVNEISYSTQTVKEKFYKQKNMLQLFINKEHIEELETSILVIEDSIKQDELSNNHERLIETICLVAHITEYTTAIN